MCLIAGKSVPSYVIVESFIVSVLPLSLSLSLCCQFSSPLWFTVVTLAGVFLEKRKPLCSCPEKSFVCYFFFLFPVLLFSVSKRFFCLPEAVRKRRGCRWASSRHGRSLRWCAKLDLNEATVFIKSNQLEVHSREGAWAAPWWMSSSSPWRALELRNSLKVRVKLSSGNHPQIWLACL